MEFTNYGGRTIGNRKIIGHSISDSKLRKLRDFLNLRFGIFIDDNKLFQSYRNKILRVMQKFKYRDFSDFYEDIIFNRNSHLTQEVINVITVNETYFFRERYQFETLINYVIPELHKKRPMYESINILSAPCSSGEEIYSIAIYLLEEGTFIKQRDFMLLGIDIDSSAINKAKEGIYSERSLNKVPESIRNKFFIKDGKFYRVRNQLKNAVNFRVVNVLDKHAMKRLGKFDVVFCRNLLIYFDEKNRKETLANFYSIMKENSYLFLGHAERIPDNFSLFKRVKIGNSYIYKKV